MRLETIEKLEGRYAPAPSGDYYLVSNEKFHTPYGSSSLLNYEPGTLAVMLEDSMSQEQYERWYNDQQRALAWVAG